MITKEQANNIEWNADLGDGSDIVSGDLISENLREEMLVVRMQHIIKCIRSGQVTYKTLEDMLSNIEKTL